MILDGTCNPYIKFAIAGKQATTKVMNRTLNPEWYETVTIPNIEIVEPEREEPPADGQTLKVVSKLPPPSLIMLAYHRIPLYLDVKIDKDDIDSEDLALQEYQRNRTLKDKLMSKADAFTSKLDIKKVNMWKFSFIYTVN